MRMPRLFSSLALTSLLATTPALLAGCPTSSGEPTPEAEPDANEPDAGEPDTPTDGGEPETPADAGEPDASTDAGEPDTPVDAGTTPQDAGAPPRDAGADLQDAGTGPTDAGASMSRDECDIDDDCQNGGSCLQLPSTSNQSTFFCVSNQAPPTERCLPDAGPGDGDCCENADCPQGNFGAVCAAFYVGYCGGAPPPAHNTCRSHQCVLNEDCGNGEVCIPAGAFGLVTNTCLPATCADDSDCDAAAGGECRPYASACHGIGGFMCTYDDSECREDGDCTAGLSPICVPDMAGVPQCVDNPPAP